MLHRRSFRVQNVLFNIANDASLGPIVRMVQWPSYFNRDLERYRRDPRILEILTPLLGRDLKQIINQMHWKPPGAAMAEFGFHQDSRSRRPREAYRELATSYIQTGIAVDPHRAENGAMVMAPGSHRLGELPFDPNRHSMHVSMDGSDLARLGLDPRDVVTLEMEPGDLAFWSVHTLHGSGPNRSNIDRRLYINGYVIAENCERGEWAFRDGEPVPLSGDPALVHYEELHTRPGPLYVD
jgi:ectoine hydroxylase-related dioxygenase (phytanoyl-CoA dioxygenase family)